MYSKFSMVPVLPYAFSCVCGYWLDLHQICTPERRYRESVGWIDDRTRLFSRAIQRGFRPIALVVQNDGLGVRLMLWYRRRVPPLYMY